MSLLKSTIKNAIKFLFWMLAFLTPLLFVSNTKEVYEFPKVFFIYFLGSTVILLFLIGLLFRFFKIKKPPLPIVLFLLVTTISTLFSSHPYTSLWGYYSRFSGGLILLLVYFGLFVVLFSLFDRTFIFSLITFSLIFTSIPISLLGLSQFFGWSGTPIERVYSTFGQANWLASYLSLVVLLAVHRFLKTGFTKKLLFWLGLFLLSFSCFWFTFSISGSLGLVTGLILLFLLNRKDYRLKRSFILVFLALFIAISFPGVFFLKIQDAFLDLPKFLTSLFSVYAQETSHKVADPGFIRLGLWKSTIKMIFSSPKAFLLGYGPETFPYNFPFFRLPILNYSSEWSFILNKPHNYYLELIVETGIFSFIFYVWILTKAFLKKHLWITPMLGSFLVSNFFGWPAVTISLYFWFFLAGVFKDE